jgi:NADPH2:quinone reductase
MTRSTLSVLFHQPGGTEVLQYQSQPCPDPQEGEVVLEHAGIGVNYIDIQQRSGRYRVAPLPAGLGVEASGRVLDVGPGVRDFKPGDRVAYLHAPGAYTQYRVVPVARLVSVPEALSLPMVGVNLTRGLTAQYLVHDSYAVHPGCTVLVHSAAGGVGQILTQWAVHLGARVIGTVGAAHKMAAARQVGCHAVVLSTDSDMVAQVRALTGGLGVNAVYDGIGGDMFERSLQCLAPSGTMVTYGTPAGAIPPFDVFRLNQMGSLHLTSPSIFTYNKSTEQLRLRSADFFSQLLSGAVRLPEPDYFSFDQAAQAQDALASRQTLGAVGLRFV